ncbi:MAG TPA: type II toxin-antitoxin system prevent-host-death family antitoxin [Stackebrandtia sp.]|jgi:antitoxin (DNA-binding transcriptional repressor) of toxin-antitoxin stability system|uniref:type II toxin-antitoxin system Phd/YefM family antitoxin n=1 Tax=Stackebrandtia sp. TaxID=2023065 RepID=UPI002D4C1117|nr:type II toxin-antitoxin system prevent-host-death family antitoxin [Stackebrandtia sp.]HZE40710.1 type II toxin-antitoxin system prevent-host-death family antitoxin [Stackebrandtia sp.]
MSRVINQRDLRNDSGKILQAVSQGETFIVARNGTPMAELRPLPGRMFVSKEEAIRGAEHLPPMDYAKLRAELDELIDQDPFRDR